MITSIKEAKDLKGKKVIVRADFNVPIQDGKVMEDLRIQKTLPTINFLKEQGAKIVLISHIEAKDGSATSLEPVAEYLKAIMPVTFIKDFLSLGAVNTVNAMAEGDVVLFENLRVNAGEKKNDMEYAKQLAQFGDLYVNDAFAVSHRAHASVVALPSLLPHYAGFQLLAEIEHIRKVFNPPRPFVFILGGAKFDTKLPLIEKFLTLSDYVFVGGALANNFFKEQGYNVGTSLVSEGNYNLKEHFGDQRLVLPVDVVVKSADGVSIKKPQEVTDQESIVDVGPASVEKMKSIIAGAKFVLWNGPLGNYEEGFKDQTIGMAKVIIESGVEGAIGGGDTVAAVSSLDFADDSKVFISTGGGAMLEYLLNETLPGIDALK